MEDEAAAEILNATYRALCDHGYADLTLRDIAAEAERSKASIHYHYGCKDRLFAAFLDFLYERHTERVDSIDGVTPRERLDALLETLLTDVADAPRREFRTAMLEVKAQAPYDEAIQERLAEFDEFLFAQVREILAAGVERGEFDASVDPAVTAEFLTSAIQGAHTRQVAADHPPDRVYAAMTDYAETHLLADERTEVAQ